MGKGEGLRGSGRGENEGRCLSGVLTQLGLVSVAGSSGAWTSFHCFCSPWSLAHLCEALPSLVSQMCHSEWFLSLLLGSLWEARGWSSLLWNPQTSRDFATFWDSAWREIRALSFFKNCPQYLHQPLRSVLWGELYAVPRNQCRSDMWQAAKEGRSFSYSLMFSLKYFICTLRRFHAHEGLGFLEVGSRKLGGSSFFLL